MMLTISFEMRLYVSVKLTLGTITLLITDQRDSVTVGQAKSSKLLTGRDRGRSPRSTTCQ